MKAKELMIGDIVYYNESIVKVTSINPFVVGFTYCDTNEGDASTDMCIEPIPLTEEILLANGFESKEVDDFGDFGCGLLFEYDKEDGQITVFWEDSCNAMDCAGFEYTTDEIWYVNMISKGGEFDKTCFNKDIYVHQLQHALRLCGLSDLADNFKIE